MLSIENVSFSYSGEKSVLSGINFNIKPGEIVSILGESGSGKSTLLKLIYGLEDTEAGKIFYDEKKVTGPKFNLIPGNPEMKFVPQEFDLLDSITVGENVGKYLSNFDLPLKSDNIIKALKVVKLDGLAHNFPSQLSGGQRQRVSIARAIATGSKMLLLDEPYSHLDQPLKLEIRKSVWKWAKENNCSLILTTHDSNDALGFSDQIMILKEGEIIQKDSPEKLRDNPSNEYVAGILGEYSILNPDEMKNLFEIEIPPNKKAIIYPEEIVENETGLEFEIIDTRFRGRDYLIEARKENTVLKFYYESNPDSGIIKLNLKNFRLV